MSVDLARLRDRLAGALHLPGEERYALLAAPWNAAVSPTPLAVVEVASPDDVVAAVQVAADAGLPVAVQCTGHGIASALDGVLLVHTGALTECTVHPEGWAQVGAGVRWQTVIDAAAPLGLAPVVGSAPDVGVVGFLTGGGVGPVVRSWGAGADHVRAFEVVTGDGRVRRATATEEPDLFWGLRGGKGTLGIVTAVEIDLVHQPQIYGGGLYVDGAHARDVLHAWREWALTLPTEGTTSVALLNLPPGVPGVPPPLAGRSSVAVRFVWTGDPEAGEQAFAPMRAVAEPLMDAVGVLPFAQIAMVHADPVDPVPGHEATDLLTELPPAAVDALLAVAGPDSGTPLLMAELRHLGGALTTPADPGAFVHRDAPFNLELIGMLVPPVADAVRAAAAQVREAMAPWASGGALANFAAGGGTEDFRRCFDAPTWERLTGLAERYDPARVFRVGQVARREDASVGA